MIAYSDGVLILLSKGIDEFDRKIRRSEVDGGVFPALLSDAEGDQVMTNQSVTPEAASLWRFISSSLDRLVALALEIDDEGFTWRPPAPNTNSIAALAFHTLGNAEENILETLCGQTAGGERIGGLATIDRERDSEFAKGGRSKAELDERWRSLRPQLEQALSRLPDAELDEERRHPRRGVISGRDILIVVARHAAEHLGQAELTRDLWLASRDDPSD
jgi:hypothetical protein